MKKKMVLFILALFVLGLLVSGCDRSNKADEGKQEAAKPQEIHIAYQNSSITILLAKAKGLYEEEFGKDGIPIKYDMYALLVRPDSPFKTVSDLKGKKIAVPVGSSAHHYLILLLKQNNLTTNDVNIVNMQASDHQAALETNNVDAVATWEPWASVLENAGAGKIFADSSSGVKRYLGVLLIRNDFAKQYPTYAERLLKVNEKAVAFIKTHPDEALELIARESKLPVSALSRLVKSSDWDSTIVPEDIAAFQQVKDFLKDTKVLKKDFDIKELFDDQYLKRIKQ